VEWAAVSRSHRHADPADEPEFRLVRPRRPARGSFVPDAEQARVLATPGGPLLVLAGPGTGKTPTMVEAVAQRVEAGLHPSRCSC
jgi:MoxR-like ATPase